MSLEDCFEYTVAKIVCTECGDTEYIDGKDEGMVDYLHDKWEYTDGEGARCPDCREAK